MYSRELHTHSAIISLALKAAPDFLQFNCHFILEFSVRGLPTPLAILLE